MSRIIAIDTETYWNRKLKYTVRTQIVDQYAASPLFECFLVSACDGVNSWAGEPSAFNWKSLNGQTLVSHNARFDKAIIAEMVKRGQIPAFTPKEWLCTADMTSFLCNRRSLDAAVEHLLGQKVDKTVRADSHAKHWPTDFSADEQTAMLKYAREDALWTWRLFDKFGHLWPANERRLSTLTSEQGARGVQINRELLNTYLMNSHEMLQKTAALLPWLRDVEDEDEGEYSEVPNKPTSVKAVADQCRRAGIPCPPPKSKDPEEYEEWEEKFALRHTWIQALSQWRSLNKLYQTGVKIKERLRDDGTLPFSLKYFGAHTGRWSGDAGVNFQNLRKVPVLCNEHGLMESSPKRIAGAVSFHAETHKWPEWVAHTIDFRHLIIPRPGKRMITSDLAAIEPRILAWCAGDTAFLQQVASGMSCYEAHARGTMNWTGGNLKKEDPKQYALAKARVLALGYGAGADKFITMAQTLAGIDITEGDPEFEEVTNVFTGEVKQVSGYGQRSRAIVKEFREQNARIVALWKTLDEAFKRSVGEDFVLKLPSGRSLRFEAVRAEYRIEKDRETGKPRKKAVFTAIVGGRRVQSYGGKLCENLVQSAARDCFAEHLIRLEDAGLPVLFSCHDEAILEVDESVQACDVEHIMSQTPDWIAGLPLAAEANVVPHYCK